MQFWADESAQSSPKCYRANGRSGQCEADVDRNDRRELHVNEGELEYHFNVPQVFGMTFSFLVFVFPTAIIPPVFGERLWI